MDFNQPIALQTTSSAYIEMNTLTSAVAPATPLSGYIVDSVTLGTSAVRGFIAEKAQRDGIQAAEAFFGPRDVSVIVQAFGSTLGDFWDKVDALSIANDPYPNAFESDAGFRKLRFYSPTGSTSRQVYMSVRPTALAGIRVNKNMSQGSASKGFATNVQMNFVAVDPRKISVTEYTQSISTGTTTVAYTGNYEFYPQFIFTPSGTSLSYVIGGRTVSLIGLSAGTAYYVDHNKATVRTGSFTGPLAQGKVSPSATTGFGYLSSQFSSTVVVTGGLTSGSIIYRNAWL